jgi:hypothetical protein
LLRILLKKCPNYMIQKYGENVGGNDHTTLTEFMCKNLAIVSVYMFLS